MGTYKVFCVRCNHLIEHAHARLIFQTGFYKTNIPLAQCRKCLDSDETANNR